MKPFFSVVLIFTLVLLAVFSWSSSGTSNETTQLPPVSILLGGIGAFLLLRKRNSP